ncbi:MAG: helix-hairpin-helix domain-containing protein [candidate division WOR-3 bacterium]
MPLFWLLLLAPSAGKSDFTVVRVIWTSDLHAQLLSTADFASPGSPRRQLGGITGLIRLIQEQKTPATLLLDNGDFAFGSPEGDSSQGRVMTFFMNRLGYDAAVLGARDFRDGLVTIELLARSAGFPILADPMLNILLNRQTPLFRPWLVKDVRGVKVGIIGLSDPEITLLNTRERIPGMVIDEPLYQVRRLLPAVKAESAEIVIVLGHITAEQGRIIAESLPEIDLVICRGEQQLESQLPRSGKTAVVSGGVYGQRLGVADILFHKTERRVYAIEAQLLNVQPGTETVPQLKQFILNRYDTTAAYSTNEFFPDESGRRQLALAIAEALRQKYNADLVILPLSATEAGLPSAPLTRRDLFNAVPYQEKLKMLTLPESLLNQILKPAGIDENLPAPAVAGADLFVLGDTSQLRTLADVAGIRLRDRKRGDYKLITTETWLEMSGLTEKGKTLPENLTDFWLRYVSEKGTITTCPLPRLYPATAPQAQQTQKPRAGLININTADLELLCQLPGIGPKTAQRIIEYRQTHGKFKSIEEIMNVRGIGPKKFEQIKNLISVQ